MIKLPIEMCCGCGECASLCPTQAIKMKPDERGFLRPNIDEQKCIGCALCERECVVHRAETIKNTDTQVCYGAKNYDEQIRLSSSSGGCFSAFAEYILNIGGAVYGVATEGKKVFYVRAICEMDLVQLRGSKYVQSDLTDFFHQIGNDLKNGKTVLFSGTPCQCAAVKNYIKKLGLPDSRLYLLDFVCHGVTSPLVFSDYIQYCEKKASKKIHMHIFRDKQNGWTSHIEKNVFEDGTFDSKSFESQLYKRVYYKRLASRQSCFNCRFSTLSRVSDITMGDFWGIQNSHFDQYDETGASMLIVNSKKGKTLLELADGLELFDAKIDDFSQPQLHTSTAAPKGYDDFWLTYKKGFRKAMNKYCYAGPVMRVVVKFAYPIKKRLLRK